MPFNVFLPMACLLLVACAQQPAQPVSSSPAAAAATTTPTPDYSERELNDLLVAEVAAQNGQLDAALTNYTQQATATEDPAIAEQAARLALYMGRAQTALEMATLWLKQQPGSVDAVEIQTLAHVLMEQTDAVKKDVNRLLTLEPAALSQLLSHSQDLTASQVQILLAAMADLATQYPAQAPLWFARALIEQQQEHYLAALKACDHALAINPDHLESWILKARLLVQAKQPDKAVKVLKKAAVRFPDKPMLAITRIQLLLQQQETRAARKAVMQFAQHFPDEQDMQLALAQYALQQQAPDVALPLLEQLQQQHFSSDETNFWLGQTYAALDQSQLAINAYLRVKGDKALQAGAEAARLLYRQNQNAEAINLFERLRSDHPDKSATLYAVEGSLLINLKRLESAAPLLEKGLATFPKDPDLLYLTAMLEDKQGNYANMEKHLLTILEVDPNNTNALNALGYTLTNHSARYQEAWYYIKRAHAREPNNPAIQDSLGWVLFKLGRLDEALPLLQQAWSAQPDPEVAAHLVEALRAKPDTAAAEQLLKEARLKFPASPFLTLPLTTPPMSAPQP